MNVKAAFQSWHSIKYQIASLYQVSKKGFLLNIINFFFLVLVCLLDSLESPDIDKIQNQSEEKTTTNELVILDNSVDVCDEREIGDEDQKILQSQVIEALKELESIQASIQEQDSGINLDE